MNFFNPLMFEATPRNNNTQSAVSAGTIPRYLSGYVPTQVTYREYEPSVQFKVFAFDQVNSGRVNLGDASNVYRFELLENRSFAGFLNVLNGHGVSQSHKFNYVDDEQDLVVLATEYDFKYMLKIMKGKTIKIVCEKIPHPTITFTCPRAQRSNCSGFRNLPFFTRPIRQQESEENLIENALDSVFSGIFEKKQERPQQVFNPSNAHRVRTIRLSDLLKEANTQKEEEKPEKKEEKQARTFEDYLAEVFGKKLAERRSQEEQTNKQETKEEKPVAEQHEQQVIEEKKEEPIQSQQEEKQVETPILTTSQIISNYLIEDDDTITEEESEDDELSSVASGNQEVQYPTLRQEEEQSNSVSETSNQEQPNYEKELKLLSDMGFSDQTENLTLLTKYSGDVQRAVSELIYNY